MHIICVAGAQPNLGDNRGYTPLHFAALANHEQVVRELLQGGADYTLYTTDANQEEAIVDTYSSSYYCSCCFYCC